MSLEVNKYKKLVGISKQREQQQTNKNTPKNPDKNKTQVEDKHKNIVG